MLKVVYFDEQSATDLLDIKYGGKFQSVEEQLNRRTSQLRAKIDAQVGAGVRFFRVLKAALNSRASAEIAKYGSSVFKNTFTNTVLTDFVGEARATSNSEIVIFTGYKLIAKTGSFAHTKMYTPYTVLIREESSDIDLSKLDEVLENAKGYYELLAFKDQGKVILRFNISAFRNNYGLTDLPKMKLMYYAIKVGRCAEDDLLMEKEMTHGQTEINVTDIFSNTHADQDTYLDVFDVILAGVGNE